jgi:hypothetical protein
MGDKGIQRFELGKGHRLNELHVDVVTFPKVDENVCDLVVSVECGCHQGNASRSRRSRAHGGPLFEWVCR